MTDAAGSESWAYDRLGRVGVDSRTTNNLTKSFAYGYNYVGSITSIAYPSGRTITYSINPAAQPISAVDSVNSINYVVAPTTCPNGQTASGACYRPEGLLASLQNGANLVSTFFYNSRLQPCRSSVKSSGTAPNSCSDPSHTGNVLDFTYDFHFGSGDNDNLYKQTDNTGSRPNINYTYDTLNRLATAYTDATSGTCWGETFTVDPWANLTAIGAKSGYTGCTQENLSISVGTKNQITGFSYDAAGNLATDGVKSYSYDAETV